MVGDVGRAGDLRLVAGDEHAVLGDDEVGLDVVGALARRQLVGGERVLRPVAGRAAVADHERLGLVRLCGLAWAWAAVLIAASMAISEREREEGPAWGHGGGMQLAARARRK